MTFARTPLAVAAATILVLAAVASTPAPLHAEQDGAGAHERLVAAVASDRMRDRLFEQQLDAAGKALFDQDPELAAYEAECPGLIDTLVAGLAPVLRRSHKGDYDWFRGRLLALFARELSRDDAAGAAEFFGSELGQRLLLTIAAQQDNTNVIRDIMANDDMGVSEQALASDRAATVRRVQETLSRQDRDAIAATWSRAGWFPAFSALQPRIHALNLEMANRDFTAEEYAEIDSISATVAEEHFTRCDAGQ